MGFESLGYNTPEGRWGLKWSRFIPHLPTARQVLFLLLNDREAMYGGAAGGGKSDALLMAALQYVDHTEYSAILFRRTYSDLVLPDALMDRAARWLSRSDARWLNQSKTWVFPSGARLTFGYLDHENQKYRYQGSSYNFIGFDELTQFSESQYTYLMSRLRRGSDSLIPTRIRCASNPGGLGHDWVKARFITAASRPFVPAYLADNPHLDQEDYEASLRELDPITRRQLLDGDWDASQQGTLFERHWFQVVDTFPSDAQFCRYWDLAATPERAGRADQPAWTAGVLVGMYRGTHFVIDVQRLRGRPADVEKLVQQTAILDQVRLNRAPMIRMEREPGSSGVNTIDHYARRVLTGFDFAGDRPSGSKIERARPVSSAAEQGNIKVVVGPWNEAFLNELAGFPYYADKDQVDALSGAISILAQRRRMEMFI